MRTHRLAKQKAALRRQRWLRDGAGDLPLQAAPPQLELSSRAKILCRKVPGEMDKSSSSCMVALPSPSSMESDVAQTSISNKLPLGDKRIGQRRRKPRDWHSGFKFRDWLEQVADVTIETHNCLKRLVACSREVGRHAWGDSRTNDCEAFVLRHWSPWHQSQMRL